jgi:hypothetical protein
MHGTLIGQLVGVAHLGDGALAGLAHDHLIPHGAKSIGVGFVFFSVIVAYVSIKYRARRDPNLERGLEVRRHALEAARTLKQTQLRVAMLLLSLLTCLLIYLALTR